VAVDGWACWASAIKAFCSSAVRVPHGFACGPLEGAFGSVGAELDEKETEYHQLDDALATMEKSGANTRISRTTRSAVTANA
jgi:hypothetical protein